MTVTQISATPTATRARRRANGGDEMPRPARQTTAGQASKRLRRSRRTTGARALPRGAASAVCGYLASGYTDAETADWLRPEFEVTPQQVARYRRGHEDEIAALREQLHEEVTLAGIGVPEERVLRLNRAAAYLETRFRQGDHRECALLVARYLDLLKLVAKQSSDGGARMAAESSQGGLARERQEYALSGERYQAAFRALARAAAALGGVAAANRPAD
jgi:hypothetical protein